MNWLCRVAVLAAAAVLASSGASGAPQEAQGDDLSGFWVLQGYKPTRTPPRQRIPRTIEGTTPPLKPEAARIYEQRIVGTERGDPFLTPSAKCLTNGMPLMMMADTAYPFQIVQSPGQVTLLLELWRNYRTIRLDSRHLPDQDASYMGDSVGHWEGKTLVVDTTNLTDKTVLDMTGMPHSDKMRVTERIRKMDDSTLEDLITVDDPGAFTRPWTTRMTYKSTVGPIEENICENNQDVEQVKR